MKTKPFHLVTKRRYYKNGKQAGNPTYEVWCDNLPYLTGGAFVPLSRGKARKIVKLLNKE